MTTSLTELRADAVRFLESMRVGDAWDFRFSPSSGRTLIGSSMAAMLAGLTRWADGLSDREKSGWARRIQGCQREDGWFEDDDIAAHNLRPGYARDRAMLHRTRHALFALDVLGQAPAHGLAAVEQWLGAGAVRAWCETLDLGDYWYCSNMMMDAAIMLLAAAEWEERSGAVAAVHELLDFCDEHVDPNTGFHDAGRSEVRNAMAGAMHLYPVYIVLGRPIHRAGAAIRTTLDLQQPDGLFGYESGTGGEDCLDYDAASIVANLGFLQPDSRPRIAAALQRLREGLEVCRNPDGGFAAHRRSETYYFGTSTTPVGPGESSLWATYSRLLTCVAIKGFLTEREPGGFRTAHNLFELWDGGRGLSTRAPIGMAGG